MNFQQSNETQLNYFIIKWNFIKLLYTLAADAWWGQWSAWNLCTVTCGAVRGSRSRIRSCVTRGVTPDYCVGKFSQIETCQASLSHCPRRCITIILMGVCADMCVKAVGLIISLWNDKSKRPLLHWGSGHQNRRSTKFPIPSNFNIERALGEITSQIRP